ncbi:MAG: hypothetical protein ACOYL1_06030 [Chlamydiia bacterium]|jgi:hypothetical protein
MKLFLAMLLVMPLIVQAQITYFNNSSGLPLGTANQIGNITYFNDSAGLPLGTANQVGRITYFNDAAGLPLGTAISPQPVQPYYVPQFNNQPIPNAPVIPIYPGRMR